MSANSRMTLAVHVLTWIAFDRRGTVDEVGTSRRMAASVNTNPVVIRRCLGELRNAGLVQTSRGRGWKLTRDASELTLHDVYLAVGGEMFAMHASPPDHQCHVGHGIQPVLLRAYQGATEAMCGSLARTTIADILRDTLAQADDDTATVHRAS
ncbi:Rrf2 family transcriptional regulator [Mycolicibacterium obuense]|uniref:Rrf2 family transcriptional regulator n=1 Tax=Mycolicibacterium obuense TaxID=1807 RepID=A0A0M2K1T9_9MYCO|nr:Rrf2 family transcriptional regulator [Mycolicibacterium obuense]KKF00876.1 Rrf2 family transcriptional regulator [Mycolicibacterium obuense]